VGVSAAMRARNAGVDKKFLILFRKVIHTRVFKASSGFKITSSVFSFLHSANGATIKKLFEFSIYVLQFLKSVL
jgi:hypothetical protein